MKLNPDKCPWCKSKIKIDKGSTIIIIGCKNDKCPAMPYVICDNEIKGIKEWNKAGEK